MLNIRCRGVLVGVLAGVLCALTALPLARAEETPAGTEAPEAPEVTPRLRRSVERACAWLARNQGKDGGLRSNYAVAATGLAGLAWLASGSTPSAGPHAKNIVRALRYLAKHQSRRGFISEGREYGASMMYGHGYATQFLAEAYGMIRDAELARKIRHTLVKAVTLLESTQNRFGGWNSAPNAQATDDGSGAVAIMQITALRAAESCGIYVHKRIVRKAKKYLLAMTNAQGWYAYNWNARRRGRGSPGTTAAGMYMLGAMNLHDDPRYAKGIRNLLDTCPFLKGSGGRWGRAGGWGWYFYTCFYASLAVFQHGGREWRRWHPAMVNDLCKRQRRDGSWNDPYGGVMTSLAVLCLELPYRYLPLFQEGGAGMEGR